MKVKSSSMLIVSSSALLLTIIVCLLSIIDPSNCQTGSVTPISSNGESITSNVSYKSFKYFSITNIKYFYISFTNSNIVIYLKKGSTPTTSDYDYYLSGPQTRYVSVSSLSDEWYIGVYGQYASTIFTIDVSTTDLSLPGWIVGIIVGSVILFIIIVIASIAIPILICCGVCSGLICCATAVAVESDRTPIVQRHYSHTHIVNNQQHQMPPPVVYSTPTQEGGYYKV
ncbi:hypothetical protein ABK040_000210 [Willaertia magna]